MPPGRQQSRAAASQGQVTGRRRRAACGRLGRAVHGSPGKLKCRCSRRRRRPSRPSRPVRHRAHPGRCESAGFPRDREGRRRLVRILPGLWGTCPVTPTPLMGSWTHIPKASLPDPQKGHPVCLPFSWPPCHPQQALRSGPRQADPTANPLARASRSLGLGDGAFALFLSIDGAGVECVKSLSVAGYSSVINQ